VYIFLGRSAWVLPSSWVPRSCHASFLHLSAFLSSGFGELKVLRLTAGKPGARRSAPLWPRLMMLLAAAPATHVRFMLVAIVNPTWCIHELRKLIQARQTPPGRLEYLHPRLISVRRADANPDAHPRRRPRRRRRRRQCQETRCAKGAAGGRQRQRPDAQPFEDWGGNLGPPRVLRCIRDHCESPLPQPAAPHDRVSPVAPAASRRACSAQRQRRSAQRSSAAAGAGMQRAVCRSARKPQTSQPLG
jgi:hypothetical protein